MNTGRLSTYAKVAVVTLVVLLLWRTCSQAKDYKEMKGLYEAAQDTLVRAKDNLGREFVKISILTAESEKALLQMKSKDSTITWLQATVEDYKGKLASATVVSNSTTSSGSTGTIVTHDTIWIDDTAYLIPVYETQWADRWEEGTIRATEDSIYRHIRVKNEFEITMGAESNGWFKKRQATVTVKNLNPNTITEELRSFQVDHHQKKLGIGIQVGYGISLASPIPSPYLGVGLDYRLISVK